ncbi:MAG TPA: PIN domain-containing protein [Allosphingosinicella sp.]|jgi:predicted nucleic acid-binding protein
MGWLIDTNIAIRLRDGDGAISHRMRDLEVRPSLSIISHVELENGVCAQPAHAGARRAAVDLILANLTIHPFEADALAAYRSILAAVGYSRPRVADRMIAATAIAHDLTLLTMNGRDFRDIPGLRLEEWQAAAG